MSEIIIRDCSADDFESINILINQIHSLHVKNRPDIYKETDEPLSENDYLEILDNDMTISILAENRNIVVGFCMISIKEYLNNPVIVPRRIAYMDDLCVHKDYRKQGIGKRLFNEAAKRALDFNVDSMELMVWEFNDSAIDFYERQGLNTRSRIMEIKLMK